MADMETRGWSDIETAPKDGTRFLAYVPIQNHRMVIAMAGDMGMILNESYLPMPYKPTHWMPLPPPPKAEGVDAAGEQGTAKP